MTRRLFFALQPSAAARTQIQQVMTQLTEPALRLHHPADLHQTLVFLGQTDTQRCQQLTAFASTLSIAPLRMQFDRLEYWAKPQILCLTSTDRPAALLSLVEQLQHYAQQLGYVLDERPYRPHITLARKAAALPAVQFPPIVLEASTFSLMASVREESTVRYRQIQSFHLY